MDVWPHREGVRFSTAGPQGGPGATASSRNKLGQGNQERPLSEGSGEKRIERSGRKANVERAETRNAVARESTWINQTQKHRVLEPASILWRIKVEGISRITTADDVCGFCADMLLKIRTQ